MRVLLDTHILIWALANTPRLSSGAKAVISDAGDEICFSAASVWEIAIEARLGRISFAFEPEQILVAAGTSGRAELAVDAADARRPDRLADHHSDPFDRPLVAQAIGEGAVLLTSDAALPPYPPPRPPGLNSSWTRCNPSAPCPPARLATLCSH